MYIEIHLEQNKNAFILFLSDFWSVRCKHLLYMYLFFIAYDLQGTYEYDGIYAPNLLIIIWSLFLFTAFNNVSGFLPDLLNFWSEM